VDVAFRHGICTEGLNSIGIRITQDRENEKYNDCMIIF